MVEKSKTVGRVINGMISKSDQFCNRWLPTTDHWLPITDYWLL